MVVAQSDSDATKTTKPSMDLHTPSFTSRARPCQKNVLWSQRERRACPVGRDQHNYQDTLLLNLGCFLGLNAYILIHFFMKIQTSSAGHLNRLMNHLEWNDTVQNFVQGQINIPHFVQELHKGYCQKHWHGKPESYKWDQCTSHLQASQSP